MAPPVELREFYQAEHQPKLPLTQRLWNGFTTNPAAFLGGAGFVGMVAYAAKNFKNRKSTASMYVMHYRVVAQFMFIGAMGGGVAVGLLYAAFMGDPRKRNIEQQESKDNMASK